VCGDALAAVAVSGAAFAQNATISGNLSFGQLSTHARTGGDVANKVTTIGAVDNFNSNRLTVTVTEDLGGGLRATGVIDNRLTTQNADRGTGDMFVRLSGGFGTVQIGRYTFASHAGFNAFASRAVSSLATPAGSIGTDSISYTTPSTNGFTATVGLAFDTSVGGAGANGTGVRLNYAQGPLSVQFSQTTAAKTTATMTPVKVTGLAATYNLGFATVMYNQNDSKAGNNIAANKGSSLSVAVPMGAATLRAGMMNRKGDTNNTIVDRTAYGVDYALSKRTTLVAEFGTSKQAVSGTNKKTDSFIGVNHTF
jgi:predicted porin